METTKKHDINLYNDSQRGTQPVGLVWESKSAYNQSEREDFLG